MTANPCYTNPLNTTPLAAIAVVLHRPQEAVNVGAVVRAMKNMGVNDLRLVQPADFDRNEILRLAHRCDDILDQMTVHADLDAALADVIYVVGTAAISHYKRPLTQDLRGLAGDLINRAWQGRVALLFGQEDDGLDHHALDRCHLVAMLPSNPDYPALNLAQSVLLFLYEIRMAALGQQPGQEEEPHAPNNPVATQAELERLFQLSEEALTAIDFFRYNPTAVMRTLRQLAYRAALRSEETALLIGIMRKIARFHSR
ncbi:MAG: RNA methyltransferase [Caldilineaceae bacterium]